MSLETRIESLRKRVEAMAEQEENDLRLAIQFGGSKDNDPNATTASALLFDVNQALDQLLLMSSSILSEGVPENRYREAIFDMARKIEKLDDWFSQGGRLPEIWRKKQAGRFGEATKPSREEPGPSPLRLCDSCSEVLGGGVIASWVEGRR